MVLLHSKKPGQPVDEKTPALPPTYADENVDISAAFSNLNLSRKNQFPSVDECVAHLKLLETFHTLKEDVSFRDGLYGIYDRFAPVSNSAKLTEETLEKIREKRWAVFVAKAVKRFQLWFKNQIQPNANMLVLKTMSELEYALIAQKAEPLELNADRLPPLDVLMVWHSYILNPRTYLADCIRFGKTQTWATGLPWKSIDSVIDSESLIYEPSDEAKARWIGATDAPWNPFDEPDTVTITCPRCKSNMVQRWTTFTEATYFTSTSDPSATLKGTGFADSGFRVGCNCGMIIDHDMLRCFKFTNDLQQLVDKDVPMPGTLLTLDGLPASYKSRTDPRKTTADLVFPNQLLRDGGVSYSFGTPNDPKVSTPGEIRSIFEHAMTSTPSYIAAALKTTSSTRLRPLQRMSIRKMMACYWDNSSIFSMDLAGAVIRQGVFVKKMHELDWLHSPALLSTMRRLLVKYGRFFAIMAKYPNEVAVPTLDVDLAWHTHQLSPQAYYNYSTSTTANVFIDHDDKIADSKLSTSFEWTSKTYQKMFQSVYSECTCWYCEAIRETSGGNGLKRFFNPESGAVQAEINQLHKVSPSSDPNKAPHISAHNAITTPSTSQGQYISSIHKRKLESGYQRACARAKKEGRAPPERDAYASAYGYGGYGYYPYAAYPYWAPIYVSNPTCGSFTPGAAGNCCAGTCGGGVAMGSCAGASGSCATGGGANCGGGSGLGSVGGSCGGGSGFGGCGGGGGGGGGGCGGGGGGGGGGCGGGGGG